MNKNVKTIIQTPHQQCPLLVWESKSNTTWLLTMETEGMLLLQSLTVISLELEA